MPPMVAREAVETSTGNHSPCFFSCRLRSSSTMPGSTTQLRFADIERDDAVQMLREIDDDAVIDGLAALRGAAAARRDDPSVVARNRERPQRLVHGARHHHARGHDLVERGIGGVTAAAEGIEQHVARDLAPQARGEGAIVGRIAGFAGLRRHGMVSYFRLASLARRGSSLARQRPDHLCVAVPAECGTGQRDHVIPKACDANEGCPP